jgi:hypothetical protein
MLRNIKVFPKQNSNTKKVAPFLGISKTKKWLLIRDKQRCINILNGNAQCQRLLYFCSRTLLFRNGTAKERLHAEPLIHKD